MVSPIASVADLLRGKYKRSSCGKIILSFFILRRFDCAFSNALPELLLSPDQLKQNLLSYLARTPLAMQDVFSRYKLAQQIEQLDEQELLLPILQKYSALNLHPSAVSNADIGLLFEELIRKGFSEIDDAEAGGIHFTPREVIKLIVNLLLSEDDDILLAPDEVRTIYDCCAGAGGMLTATQEYLRELNPHARMEVFGQELNEESYALCKADVVIKGENPDNIKQGNTLSRDHFPGRKFEYMITNPPYGVCWKDVQAEVEQEAKLGFDGRFGPGLPRITEGSLLFLMHLIAKMRPANEGGSRIGIVLNWSSLSNGAAGSGESQIRRYIIENDYLEAVIALPKDIFYNTGIATYVWVLSNRKAPNRVGKVQLINAAELSYRLKKSLGCRRRGLSEEHIGLITKCFTSFYESDICKIIDNAALGFRTITVDRPLRNPLGEVVTDKNGAPKPDPVLRENENIPLNEDVESYFKSEILPHAHDAFLSHSRSKVGYRILFPSFFFVPPDQRPLAEISAEIHAEVNAIVRLFEEISR